MNLFRKLRKNRKVLFGYEPPRINLLEQNIDHSKYNFSFADFDAINPKMYDLIVPLKLDDYACLSKYLKFNNSKFIYPSKENVELTNDKSLFNDFLLKNGFGNNLPEIYFENVKFPYIYKKRIDIAGINSRIIYTKEEEDTFESKIDPTHYFKQEIIEGEDEYTAHVLSKAGKIHYFSNIVFHFGARLYIKGNQTDCNSHSINLDNSVIPLFEKILTRINYTGICCFNYKIDNNTVKIFEVNPRFGHSLIFDINNFLRAYERILK
jgi:carbamoylphosphate synthase large subunit